MVEGTILITFKANVSENRKQQIINNLFSKNQEYIDGMLYREFKEGITVKEEFNQLGEKKEVSKPKEIQKTLI